MWEVEATDDEGDNCDKSDGEKSVSGWSDASGNVPVKIALLYLQIEKNGALKLKTSCARRTNLKRKTIEPQGSVTFSPVITDPSQENTQQEFSANENVNRLAKPEMKAFSYEEEEDMHPNTVTPRRNLNSAKKQKKVASMTNVVNDLMRHKFLDELESSNIEGKSPSGNQSGLEAHSTTPARIISIAETKKKAM